MILLWILQDHYSVIVNFTRFRLNFGSFCIFFPIKRTVFLLLYLKLILRKIVILVVKVFFVFRLLCFSIFYLRNWLIFLWFLGPDCSFLILYCLQNSKDLMILNYEWFFANLVRFFLYFRFGNLHFSLKIVFLRPVFRLIDLRILKFVLAWVLAL